MRMWMIPAEFLCRKHLLGEHGEIHKHRHCFEKKYSIAGRVSPIVQIEPMVMKTRHDELAAEMVKRGMNHSSPYIQPDLSYLPKEHRKAVVDQTISIRDLCGRCSSCKKNILKKISL